MNKIHFKYNTKNLKKSLKKQVSRKKNWPESPIFSNIRARAVSFRTSSNSPISKITKIPSISGNLFIKLFHDRGQTAWRYEKDAYGKWSNQKDQPKIQLDQRQRVYQFIAGWAQHQYSSSRPILQQNWKNWSHWGEQLYWKVLLPALAVDFGGQPPGRGGNQCKLFY